MLWMEGTFEVFWLIELHDELMFNSLIFFVCIKLLKFIFLYTYLAGKISSAKSELLLLL